MKKVTTTATKQSSNFSEQKLTIGLDLGDRSSHYCVLDETGRILAESKVSTSPNAMEAIFGAWQEVAWRWKRGCTRRG